MTAIIRTSRQEIFSNSAVRKAAAPSTGGEMVAPRPPVASRAAGSASFVADLGEHRPATAAALADPEVKARPDTQGVTIVAGLPSELDTLVSREIKLFTQVVKAQGIKAE